MDRGRLVLFYTAAKGWISIQCRLHDVERQNQQLKTNSEPRNIESRNMEWRNFEI